MPRQADLTELFQIHVVRNMMAVGTVKWRQSKLCWELECQMFPGANKNACKEGIKTFLEQGWGGHDFSFVVGDRKKHGQFYVRYQSDMAR